MSKKNGKKWPHISNHLAVEAVKWENTQAVTVTEPSSAPKPQSNHKPLFDQIKKQMQDLSL